MFKAWRMVGNRVAWVTSTTEGMGCSPITYTFNEEEAKVLSETEVRDFERHCVERNKTFVLERAKTA